MRQLLVQLDQQAGDQDRDESIGANVSNLSALTIAL